MGILRRNAGKLALIALIVFFSLPFIYGNEEEEDFSPFAVKSGLSYQANPISKLTNRIASFYGLPKSNLTPTSERINMDRGENIRSRVAEHNATHKQHYAEHKNIQTNAQNNAAAAANNSKKLNSFEKDQTIIVPSHSMYENATTATSVNYNNYAYNKKSNDPAAEYIQIGGENYKVIQDITGKKYVATARGHVPYEEVLRSTVSEREFRAAKKRLVNASDAEIVQYVLDQKKAASNAENKTENKANTANTNTAGYAATGSATSMGGAAKVNSSVKTDTGFDDSILSNVYAEIKNINAKSDKPASSSSSSSSSGSYTRGSSSSGNTNSGVSGITVDPNEINRFLQDINKQQQKQEEDAETGRKDEITTTLKEYVERNNAIKSGREFKNEAVKKIEQEIKVNDPSAVNTPNATGGNTPQGSNLSFQSPRSNNATDVDPVDTADGDPGKTAIQKLNWDLERKLTGVNEE